MKTVFDVRYVGEKADMELIRSKYRVDDYIKAVEDRKRATVERPEDLVPALPPVSRDMFPRLYRILDIVLERLGLSGLSYGLRLTSLHDLQIGIATLPDQIVFYVSPEAISVYEDDELAFFFGRCIAKEEWEHNSFLNLERKKGVAEGAADQEDGDSVLPGMGNALYKRWRAKSEISLDRVGVVAAGGFDPAVKAMFRSEAVNSAIAMGSMLYPLRSSDIHIPPMDEFLKLHSDKTPDDGVYFRALALCCFCKVWFAAVRNVGDLKKIDEGIDSEFEGVSRKVESKDDKDCAMAFLAKSLEVLTQNGRVPSDAEMRAVVRVIYKNYTDNPSELFDDFGSLMKRGRSAFRRVVKKYTELDKIGVYKWICEVLYADVMSSNEKAIELDRIAEELGLDERTRDSLQRCTVIRDGKRFMDPLADEIVDQVIAKFNGQCHNKKKNNRTASGGADKQYRYCGDIEGEQILSDIYNIDRYVESVEKAYRARAFESRDKKVMRDGVRLMEKTSPRVYGVVRKVCKRLNIKIPFEVFCSKGDVLNAFASYQYHHGKKTGLIQVNSIALEMLDDDELAFVIGHEFGHLIHNHNGWNEVKVYKEDGSFETILPQMGEMVYREWEQKQELSCDRAGAIAAGSPEAAVKALIKVLYGLSSKNFDFNNIDELLQQLREIKDTEEVEDSTTISHPINPLRIKALELFCKAYYSEDFDEKKLAGVDVEIEHYYQWIRRNPRTKVDVVLMYAFVDAGVEMLLTDGALDKNEISKICEEINSFVCEPAAAFEVDRQRRLRRISASLKTIRALCDEAGVPVQELGRLLLSSLVELALSDGSITVSEHKYLLKFAARLGMDESDAIKVITDSVAEIGFPVDTLFDEHVNRLSEILAK